MIVHQGRVLGASGGAWDVWTIWLAGTKHSERDSLEAAVELACDVAAEHSRPACLLDETGYPLKLIERNTLH